MSTVTGTNSISNIASFGRAWSIVIGTAPDANGNTTQILAESTSWTPEPLKITFEVFQSCLHSWWWADVCIYNLSSQTLNTAITQGTTVQLSAGYQSASSTFGTIFSGLVYQPMWERLDIVNYKLTLKCLVGINIDGNNFASNAFSSGFTARQWVAQMAANAITPINILPQDSTSIAALENVKQSRGGVVHGRPSKYFEQAANFNGLNYWSEQAGAQILALQNPNATVPTISFGVGSGLIGTPQQTQFGMNCRVLLDSRLKPRTNIQLNQALSIRQLPLAPTQNLPTIINQSGVYTIGAVRHIGDSRGQEWYTEVTAFNGNQIIEALQAYGDFKGTL